VRKGGNSAADVKVSDTRADHQRRRRGGQCACARLSPLCVPVLLPLATHTHTSPLRSSSRASVSSHKLGPRSQVRKH
jgi:hypothetical protein